MIALLIFTFNLKDEYDVVDDDLIDTEPIPKLFTYSFESEKIRIIRP